MTAAIIYGASSGALHAVTGPDHVLSLGPLALRARRKALRIGLVWGLGHGLGTLLLALPMLALAQHVDAALFTELGDRVAGGVLCVTGAFSLWATRATRLAGTGELRNPLWVGFVHGITGAGGLVLVLPVIVSADIVRSALFLSAFAAGSTLAMGGLTVLIGRAGTRLDARSVQMFQRMFAVAAIGLGGYWAMASAVA